MVSFLFFFLFFFFFFFFFFRLFSAAATTYGCSQARGLIGVVVTGLDEAVLDKLKSDHRLVITLEDGILEGGFGEKIARYYGNSDMNIETPAFLSFTFT